MKYPPKQIGLKHIDWVGLVLATELPSISKAIVMYLSRFMNKDQDVAWPSQTRIMAELSLSKNAINSHINLLESEGWITRDRGNSKTNTRYYVSFPKLIEKGVKELSGSTSEVLRSTSEGLQVVPEKYTNSQLNSPSNSNTSKSYDSDFIAFWEKYPRKEDKKNAQRAWRRLTKEKKGKALKDIEIRYLETERKYIPLPTTYIHGERWDDVSDSFEQADQFAGVI